MNEQEETITLTMTEMREKNHALWAFVSYHIPWASGSLDTWLPIALAKIRWEKQQVKP